MKLSEMHIPEIYKHSNPSESKLNKKINYYKKNGKFKDTIVLNTTDYIVDGYITYLAAQKLGIEDLPISRTLNKKVMYGKHPGNDKEYVWILPKKMYVKPGDVVICNTKQGSCPVVVSRVEDSVTDIIGRLKTVKCTKEDKKNDSWRQDKTI